MVAGAPYVRRSIVVQDRRIDQLFREVAEKGLSRRQLIQRAAVLGISAPALTVAMTQLSATAMAQGADNPLGVDPNAPLDVVIFKGGYGDDYAKNVNTNLYGKLYPKAKITYDGAQRLQEKYQPRLVAGNPPDVMDNSGAGNFNTTELVNQDQLQDLADLMNAPAYGQDGVTFADSLKKGSQADGIYNGKQYNLNYVISAYGIWYNAAYMKEKGYEYPKTWDDMLKLCEEIKSEGKTSPWTYQGLYPQYMRMVFDQMVFKNGGREAIAKIDNLTEDAWTQDSAQAAMNALVALHDKGYIMKGTEALSHTQSQTEWLQGKAVFIPCGSWLENEMKGLIPQGFEMTEQATPSLAGDKLPQSAIQASAGEDFIVFSKGKNVKGGMEWLRLLFSKDGAKFFSQNTKSLTVVNGSADGLELGSAFASVQAAIEAAGDNTFVARYAGWYADLDEESRNMFGNLMTGKSSVKDVTSDLQDLTNQIREDSSIPKFHETPAASPAS
jgi:N-acetylglucosamine transport system substrate-binding protein